MPASVSGITDSWAMVLLARWKAAVLLIQRPCRFAARPGHGQELSNTARSSSPAEAAAWATNQKPTVLRLIVIDRGDQALREFVGA
jgi:hypothetical protein